MWRGVVCSATAGERTHLSGIRNHAGVMPQSPGLNCELDPVMVLLVVECSATS